TFGVVGTLSTVPILTAIAQTKNAWTAFFLITLALVNVSLYTSIGAVFKAELFPAEIRTLGVGLPYSIVVSIFGGTAEYAGLRLKQLGHESWFYWYVSACAAVALVTAILMHDTKASTYIDRE